MTTTSTTANEREMIERLTRNLARLTRRNESLVKIGMEDINRDFNENFEWASEQIFKCNLKLEFLNEVRKLLDDEECTIEGVRFFLRHATEHAADDIMYCDPYSGSSNEATNLAHRWNYEVNKDIYYLANNLLNNISLTQNDD